MTHKFTKTCHFARQFLRRKFSQIVYQLTLIKSLSLAHSGLNLADFREKIKVQ